jgi:UTP:GlnB (protein PII) uridylyltransferase
MALDIANKRSEYSLIRLNELKEKLENLSELKDVPNLTIFAAGSYARLEASEYSDIDMFFLSSSWTSPALLDDCQVPICSFSNSIGLS